MTLKSTLIKITFNLISLYKYLNDNRKKRPPMVELKKLPCMA